MCHCKNNIVKSNQKTPAGGGLYYFSELGVCLIAHHDRNYSTVFCGITNFFSKTPFTADFAGEFRINKIG